MSDAVQAFCVKCREKQDMLDPAAVFTSTGTPGTRGKCPVCGTKLFRMGATKAHEGLPRPAIVKKPRSKKKSGQARNTRPKKRIGRLVIVESPAKARTVGRFLGRQYTVRASMGHVRDLLVTQLSVDVENGFAPKYRVPNDKRAIIKDLQREVGLADEIYLATDPDREGEAIAWHLIQAADMDEARVKRVVFHAITGDEVGTAFDNPRSVDMDLVYAQQARRILDRLVGYNITQLLWDRVRNRLSAGRVQSIALRLVVEREREVEAFVPVEYWTLDAELGKQTSDGTQTPAFVARLVKIRDEDVSLGSEEEVEPHLDILERSQYLVQDVKHCTRQRRPAGRVLRPENVIDGRRHGRSAGQVRPNEEHAGSGLGRPERDPRPLSRMDADTLVRTVSPKRPLPLPHHHCSSSSFLTRRSRSLARSKSDGRRCRQA